MQTDAAEAMPVGSNPSVISGRQIRAARAMLRLGTRELAARAGVAPASIVRAEATDETPGMHTHPVFPG